MSRESRVEIETASVPSGGLLVADVSLAGPRTMRRADGGLVHLLNPPQLRQWGPHGDLRDSEEAGWELSGEGSGVRLRSAAAGAEIELLHLSGAAAEEFDRDDPQALVTAPAFAPFGGVDDLGDYYLAGRILAGIGHKRRVDSTALSLYRIARWRGGSLWSGIAELIAGAMADRIESASDGSLPHDLLDLGETHVRYLNDALLLMAAHREWRAGPRWDRACARAVELLRTFTVPYGGGEWILHDSLERGAGRNDLILNTHLQAMIALQAAGADTEPHGRALLAALTPAASGRAARRAARLIATLEAARSFGPERLVRFVRARRPYALAAEVCADQAALRLPGGWIARDLKGDPAPSYYATVNLVDLGGLLANRPSRAEPRAWLDAGVRFALRSGFFRAETRAAAPTAPLVPVALRLAGREREAAAFARRQLAAGGVPMIGWPGYVDSLWSNLAPGTP